MKNLISSVSGLLAVTLSVPAFAEGVPAIDHVIIIYDENRSFDALFGNYPGAEGAATKGVSGTQTAPSGFAYGKPLPLPDQGASAGGRLNLPPGGLPNRWFHVEPYLSGTPWRVKLPDLVHRFYQEQAQINGGLMDRFLEISDAGGYVLGEYDLSGGSTSAGPDKTSGVPAFLWTLARQGVLYDHFFHPAFGGSFLNHQWLISAQTPAYNFTGPASDPAFPEPKTVEAVLDADGKLITDGAATPKEPETGKVYAVNTFLSVYLHPPSVTAPAKLLPPLRHRTIGDALDDAGVSWAWYGEGYKDAAAGSPDPEFQFHHQPFAYYAKNAPISASVPLSVPEHWRGDAATEAHRLAHLKDNVDQAYLGSLNPAYYASHKTVGSDDFFAALGTDSAGNALPFAQCGLEKIAFYKPIGEANMHPGYSDIEAGDERLRIVVTAIRNSPCWGQNTVLFVTFDENGGLWDHVAPPTGVAGLSDKWGPGARVPAIMAASRLKPGQEGTVDHNSFDQTAILKLIETQFGLAPLGTRDAAQGDLTAGHLR